MNFDWATVKRVENSWPFSHFGSCRWHRFRFYVQILLCGWKCTGPAALRMVSPYLPPVWQDKMSRSNNDLWATFWWIEVEGIATTWYNTILPVRSQTNNLLRSQNNWKLVKPWCQSCVSPTVTSKRPRDAKGLIPCVQCQNWIFRYVMGIMGQCVPNKKNSPSSSGWSISHWYPIGHGESSSLPSSPSQLGS